MLFMASHGAATYPVDEWEAAGAPYSTEKKLVQAVPEGGAQTTCNTWLALLRQVTSLNGAGLRRSYWKFRRPMRKRLP